MQIFLIIVLILFMIYVIVGWPRVIDIRRDTFTSDKIKKHMRFVVISDLHANMFGENQKRILDIVDKEKPDFSVLPGDILENDDRIPNSYVFFEVFKKYPMYMSLGNHEYYIETIRDEIKKVKEAGVHLLDNEEIVIDGGVQIIGLSDIGDKVEDEEKSLKLIDQLIKKENYTILLSHRPHYTSLYQKCDVDLIISGHAHGGQWRLPNRKGGFFSPDQYLFPKYTDGLHDMHGSKLYISRGLASGRWYLPRLFNNPEIGVVDLETAKK